MAEMTRRQMRAEVENFRNLVHDRLQGRDVEKAVDELHQRVQDVIMDYVGMPDGWQPDNDDHQMAVFDIVAEELIKIYFTPGAEPTPSIEEI